ncbi:hypothetical protein [Pseudomonas fluorescens]|nr:hypothetical protein [Pseudomonas fluorescens]
MLEVTQYGFGVNLLARKNGVFLMVENIVGDGFVSECQATLFNHLSAF